VRCTIFRGEHKEVDNISIPKCCSIQRVESIFISEYVNAETVDFFESRNVINSHRELNSREVQFVGVFFVVTHALRVLFNGKEGS
jgi:hypothetical protein